MGSASRRVLALGGAFVVALGAVVLFKRLSRLPTSSIGRECHLYYVWEEDVTSPDVRLRATTELPITELQRDSGGVIVLSDGTRCVVLDVQATKFRVRVTDGQYQGATGWVRRNAVVMNEATKP